MLWDKFEDYLVDQNIDIIKGNAAANILKKMNIFKIICVDKDKRTKTIKVKIFSSVIPC